jgi:hypothetical protein
LKTFYNRHFIEERSHQRNSAIAFTLPSRFENFFCLASKQIWISGGKRRADQAETYLFIVIYSRAPRKLLNECVRRVREEICSVFCYSRESSTLATVYSCSHSACGTRSASGRFRLDTLNEGTRGQSFHCDFQSASGFICSVWVRKFDRQQPICCRPGEEN